MKYIMGSEKGMQIRKATMEDWATISEIYAGARRFMAEHGNATQWGKTNPPEELLLANIADGNLYVCMDSDVVAAVLLCGRGGPYLSCDRGRSVAE